MPKSLAICRRVCYNITNKYQKENDQMKNPPPEYEYDHAESIWETRYGVVTLHGVVGAPKNVIGYCERHHGFITKNEAKQHRCEAKGCYHLRRMTTAEVEAVSHNIRLDDMEPVD